jgi:hypothetical protein
MTLAALLVALLVAACGASAVPHHHAAVPRRMTVVQICQTLRADVLTDGGSADMPTVRHLLAQHPGNAGGNQNGYGLTTDLGQLLSTEEHPLSNTTANSMTIGTDLAALSGDCQRAAQVVIPTGA